MTVSDALKWAWGDELPKEPGAAFHAPPLKAASAWASILRYGETGTIVDRQPNRFGCIPFDQADYPHRDAIALAEAVGRLAGCSVDVPEGWHPMPELGEVDDALAARTVGDAIARATRTDADGALVFRTRPDVLVVRHAIIGLVPDWRLSGLPERKFEANENGVHKWFVRREVRSVIGENADGGDRIEVMTVEVDGWSKRLRRPVAGAYRKAYFDPDPVPVMVARAEYEIFCAAMCMLFDELAGQLETIDLVPVDWPVQPWGDGDSRGKRRGSKILPDLRAEAERVVAANRARKIKG